MSTRPAVGDVVCVDQETKTYRVMEILDDGKARCQPILGHAWIRVDLDRLTVMPERRMVWTNAAVSS